MYKLHCVVKGKTAESPKFDVLYLCSEVWASWGYTGSRPSKSAGFSSTVSSKIFLKINLEREIETTFPAF